MTMNPKKRSGAGKSTFFVLLCFCLLSPCLAEASFFNRENDYYQEDPVIGMAHRPHVRREFSWPEAGHKIVMRTNNLGFREDADTLPIKADGTYRVLVTGDSHADGVCDNQDSFANVLEARLNARHLDYRFEVINGACGHYSVDNYAGFLEKNLYLCPDALIVAIYCGNDFTDAAREIEESGKVINFRPRSYLRDLKTAGNMPWTHQALIQSLYFRTFPKMRSEVIARISNLAMQMKEICRLRQIDLLFVFLPSKPEVEWDTDSWRLNGIRRRLSLSDADLQEGIEIKKRLEAIFKESGIDYLDLLPDMAASHPKPYFWRTDYHLNVEGHRFVAEKLEAYFLDWDKKRSAGNP